jgi:hypothetical protein
MTHQENADDRGERLQSAYEALAIRLDDYSVRVFNTFAAHDCRYSLAVMTYDEFENEQDSNSFVTIFSLNYIECDDRGNLIAEKALCLTRRALFSDEIALSISQIVYDDDNVHYEIEIDDDKLDAIAREIVHDLAEQYVDYRFEHATI